jgi:cell division GTPase FtsZ
MPDDDKLAKSMEAAAGAAKRPIASPKRIAPRPGSVNVAKNLSPSSHQQGKQPEPIADAFDYDTALHMAFLGTGQGGSRIANAFWNLGYRRVGVFNTTASDFQGLADEMQKLSLDIGGAAKDATFAKQQLHGRDQEVWDLMTRAWGSTMDCAIVCASLGGGTGSGTVAALVKSARDYMTDKGRPPRVGAIVSLPPTSEGQQQCRNAVTAFRELLEIKASPLIVIDNARIHQLYKPSMAKLYATANDTVSQLLHMFNQMGAVHSDYITFDRSELAQLLDGGIVVMGAADIDPQTIQSPADVSTQIRQDLTKNVLAPMNLKKGRKGACLFVGHEEVLNNWGLEYFEAGFNQLDRVIGADRADVAKTPTIIHRGLYVGTEPGLQCYTLISELEPPYERLQELAKKGGLDAGTVSGMATFLGLND